jgi:hypothetical protein
MKKPVIVAAIAAGLSPSTVYKRIRRGWIEADLLTPPQPPSNENKARTPPKTHPWKAWQPGQLSRKNRVTRERTR